MVAWLVVVVAWLVETGLTVTVGLTVIICAGPDVGPPINGFPTAAVGGGRSPPTGLLSYSSLCS